MSEQYREGHEYVVCDECDSHFLIAPETRAALFSADPEDDEPLSKWIGFTCDNDGCEADCSVLVANPYKTPPGMSPGQTAKGEESEGARPAGDADTNEGGKDDTVAPASRGTATRRRVVHDGLLGTIDFDPFDALRRAGEESRADAAMLEAVKAGVHARTAHAWVFDPHHMAWRCEACGWVHGGFVTELPVGPCACAPSKWVPIGAAEPGPAIEDDEVLP